MRSNLSVERSAGPGRKHALTAQHLIERAAELGVAIVDQEAQRFIALVQLKAEVARLLK
jgi:hypothetical protein